MSDYRAANCSGSKGARHLSRLREGRWMGSTPYDPPARRRAAPAVGVLALDHLDSLGLCACWAGPREHRHGKAA
jgi:hypothetical protein